MENLIEDVLIEYLNFIRRYKNLIKKQNLNEEKLYGTSGVIGDYKFQYHGAGCRLEKNGTICEYDFLPKNGYPIKFSNWEIYEFIKTTQKWNIVDYSLQYIHIVLLKLVERKKLYRLEIGGVEYPVFQVKDMSDFDI